MAHDGPHQHAQISSLGNVIRRRRVELGITQEHLAALVSSDDDFVRQSDISNLERGRVKLPHRKRLERIASALAVPLGQLLAASGWAEADRFLAASLAGAPAFTAYPAYHSGEPTISAGRWWDGDVAVVRVVRARFAHNHLDTVMDGYRNAALWMATSGVGLSGFLVLVNYTELEIISLGFWSSEEALTTSPTAQALTTAIMAVGEQLAELPTIELHRLDARIAHSDEAAVGRLAQIDSGHPAPDSSTVSTDFCERAKALRDYTPPLGRAALLAIPGAQQYLALGIWSETASHVERKYDVANPTDVMYPQLITPSDSRHYVVAFEV